MKVQKQEKAPPEIQKLLESLWHYENASAMIAHAEFTGYECEKVFKVLSFLQSIREDLKNQILAIDPKAFGEQPADAQ